jgi:hypothetical protein
MVSQRLKKHAKRQGHDLRYVSRVFEYDHVMGIETYGSMVFSSMKQILAAPEQQPYSQSNEEEP